MENINEEELRGKYIHLITIYVSARIKKAPAVNNRRFLNLLAY